mmetsp:Transcript_30610/g.77084  ORF Transcript_30610/g.77084 Transcript_30610/m.77084 type:complete len:345 (-) Transcript_30610:531-1565(-)
MHQADDRRYCLQQPRDGGGARGGEAPQAPLHRVLHHPRDAHAVLALYAAWRGEGDLWLEQRHVLLGGAAGPVDGAPQDGVRVAPEEGGRAAHRRWLEKPRRLAPPGLSRHARLLAQHPRQAQGLGSLDHAARVLGPARARRLDADGGAKKVCRQRATPRLCGLRSDGVRGRGGPGGDCDGGGAADGREGDPAERVGGVRGGAASDAQGAEQEEGVRGHHWVGPQGGSRGGGASPQRRPGGSERTHLVPVLLLFPCRPHGGVPLHWVRGEARDPERVLPVCERAEVLVRPPQGARRRTRRGPCGEAHARQPRLRDHQCPCGQEARGEGPGGAGPPQQGRRDPQRR